MEYKLEILPEEQKQLFYKLSQIGWLCDYYLVGGTGLALRLGHRISIDFDFFTNKEINNISLIEKLSKIGKFELFSEDVNTVNGSLDLVKISFYKYEYPLIEQTTIYKNIEIASIIDIALMKLAAISNRGSKKDFIDLYFILDIYSLMDLLNKYIVKYGFNISNQYHLLKSLIYFTDAEKEPVPKMLHEISWPLIKEKIIEQVKKISLK